MIVHVGLIEHVNEQISSEETGRLFAVVHILGKQRKITAEDIIVMPRHIEADIGERIRLNKVQCYKVVQCYGVYHLSSVLTLKVAMSLDSSKKMMHVFSICLPL